MDDIVITDDFLDVLAHKRDSIENSRVTETVSTSSKEIQPVQETKSVEQKDYTVSNKYTHAYEQYVNSPFNINNIDKTIQETNAIIGFDGKRKEPYRSRIVNWTKPTEEVKQEQVIQQAKSIKQTPVEESITQPVVPISTPVTVPINSQDYQLGEYQVDNTAHNSSIKYEMPPIERRSLEMPQRNESEQSSSFLDKSKNYLYNRYIGIPIKLIRNIYEGVKTADKYIDYAKKAYDIHQKHKLQANISLETNGYYKIGQIDEKDNQYINLDDVYARDTKLNKSNLSAIQGVHHNGNYVVVDKANKRLHVFDKNNKLIFTTPNIATGASHNDYNTITFVDDRGEIRDNLGNMSTPAGITEITGTSPYHGAPSWTRARVHNNEVDKQDEIASSFHVGNIHLGSNGCVRMDKKTLKALVPYLNVGTRVYTLPERPGSRFSLREGKLSFTADNPYGQTEGNKKYWDDYNTSYDRSYSPLFIETNENYKGISDDYNLNVSNFAEGITQSKKTLMEEFGVDSKTYNDIAKLAMGIAQQESKFGTAETYELKQLLNDEELAKLRYYKATILGKGKKTATRSRGLTQIKMNADNDTVKARYNKYGVTTESIKRPETSALATMIRLLSMYNDEIRGRRQIKDINGNEISPYDALLYKYIGKNIKNLDTNADPKNNEYIRNVNSYGNNFNYYTRRTLRNGGRLKADNKSVISNEEYRNRMKQVVKDNWRNWGYRNEEEAYQDQINNPTYDYRSFYANNPDAVNNAETHWPDTYNGALHHTFSNESIYNGVSDSRFNPSGIKGGRWNEKGFIPHGSQFTVPNILIEKAFAKGGRLKARNGIPTWQDILNAAEMARVEKAQREQVLKNSRIESADYTTQSNDRTIVVNNNPNIQQEYNTHLPEFEGDPLVWDKAHPNLASWRNLVSASPYIIASAPLAAGISGAAGTIGGAIARAAMSSRFAPVAKGIGTGLKWLNRGLTGAFAAHGAYDLSQGNFTPITALELAGAGNPLANYYWNVETRAIETAMRTGANHDPIPLIKAGIYSMLQGYAGGKKRLYDIGKYILTGAKTGNKGYYNSFVYSPSEFYRGFINRKVPRLTATTENDIIDAVLYGKTIDPAYGMTKVAVGKDFGFHVDHIKDVYPDKLKNIQVYEINTPKSVPEHVVSKRGVPHGAKENSRFFRTEEGPVIDAGGHVEQNGFIGTNPVIKVEDIYGFNPKRYLTKYFDMNNNYTNGNHYLQKLGVNRVYKHITPIVSKAKWQLAYNAFL